MYIKYKFDAFAISSFVEQELHVKYGRLMSLQQPYILSFPRYRAICTSRELFNHVHVFPRLSPIALKTNRRNPYRDSPEWLAADAHAASRVHVKSICRF